MGAWSRNAVVVLALACIPIACGDGASDPSPSSIDAAVSSVDASGAPTSTDVRGIMDGTQFQLAYAVVLWDTSLDGVCLSNVPIEPPDCGINDPAPKYLFFGKFIYDGADTIWAFPEVELNRFGATGTHEALEFSTEGTLTIFEYDPDGEKLSLTFSVEFDEGATSGSVSIP